jgi:tRNA uridine 5-carboxymethylaminomethyl modification enzyme
VAGLNAALSVKGQPAFRLERSQGYVGILVDDLVNKGADEPYRMFTSRAEFRLQLRIDNADERLTPLGREAGLVDDKRWNHFVEKRSQRETVRELLERTRANAVAAEIGLAAATDNPTLATWLRRPEARIDRLKGWTEQKLGHPLLHGVLTTVETEVKYAGYLSQQDRQVQQLRDSEARRIPEGFSYEGIPGLSNEVRQKLTRVGPKTLGQAGRIPGVTPAAVAVLDIYLGLRPASST